MKAVQPEVEIAVQALTKSYVGASGSYLALDGVTLSIAPGEFVSLIGPSGGGKSTLLNILAGLDAPDGGSVTLHGRPLGPRPPIAYMQQKDLLLPWRTVWDNLLLGPELKSKAERRDAEERARSLLRDFRLEAFADAYPAQLSGGMRQRAALIRTLLCEQPLLLLDEPFGALDAISRGRLQKLLLRTWRDYRKTVLLVTHDVEEAVLLSNRVIVLSGLPGRVVAEFGVPLPHEARAESSDTLRLKNRILSTLEAHDAEP